MDLKPKDVRYCLDVASRAIEHYNLYELNPSRFPRSVDALQALCAEHEKKKISIVALPASEKECSIFGLYVSFGDRYCIALQPDLNPCWHRFVLCKELFHVLIDADEYRDMDIYGHLEDVKASFPVLESAPRSTTAAEVMAEIAALEFLFPYTERERALSAADSPDYLEIAKKYRIPQILVEEYLAASYMENIGAMMPRK